MDKRSKLKTVMLKAEYDSAVDAMSLVFKKGKVFETKEIADGMMLDIDKNNLPLYLEILDAKKRFKNLIAK